MINSQRESYLKEEQISDENLKLPIDSKRENYQL